MQPAPLAGSETIVRKLTIHFPTSDATRTPRGVGNHNRDVPMNLQNLMQPAPLAGSETFR